VSGPIEKDLEHNESLRKMRFLVLPAFSLLLSSWAEVPKPLIEAMVATGSGDVK
jgi:hypothetical protein